MTFFADAPKDIGVSRMALHCLQVSLCYAYAVIGLTELFNVYSLV